MPHVLRNVGQPTLLLAIALLAALFGRGLITDAAGRAALTELVPYTVMLHEFVVDPDGESHLASRITHAARSDGSLVLKLGAEGRGSRMITLAAGLRLQTDDTNPGKSTIRTSGVPAQWHRDPASGCINSLAGTRATGRGEVLVGVEEISGFRAFKVSAAKNTWWFAADHGCAPVGSRMDFGVDGASEQRLVRLIPGEPSPVLFAIPENYNEGPPSLLGPKPSDKCTAACLEQLQRRNERMDAHYYEHRTR